MPLTHQDDSSSTVFGTGSLATTIDVSTGDLIVVFITTNVSSTWCTGVTDQIGNSYTVRTELVQNSSVVFAYVLSSAGADATNIITATFNNANSVRKSMIASCYQPDGGDTVTLDDSSSGSGIFDASPWSTTVDDINTTGDDELVIAGFSSQAAITYSNQEIPSGTPATVLTRAGSNDTCFYRILSATLSNGEGETDSSATNNFIAGILAFKSEAGGIAVIRSISDTVGVSDTVSIIGTYIRIITDNIGITAALAIIGTFKRQILDAIGVTDVLSFIILIAKSIADTVGITSLLAKIGAFKRSIADTLGITDAIAIIGTYKRSITDTEGVSDTVSPTVILGIIIRSIADTIGVTDAVSRIGAFKRSITDAIGISDVLSRVGTFFRSISDTIGLTDVLTSSAAIVLKIINKLSNISTGKSIGGRMSTGKEVDSTITTEVEKDAEL